MCNSKDLVPLDIEWSSEVMCIENDTYRFNIYNIFQLYRYMYIYMCNSWDDDKSEDNKTIGDDDYTVILP